MAKAEDFQVKLVNTFREGIFATLSDSDSDSDIIISGITIIDKRKQRVFFSALYFPTKQAILIANTPRWTQSLR